MRSRRSRSSRTPCMTSARAGPRAAQPSRCGMRKDRGAGHWIVYMLECADNTLYTGITNDLARRLAEQSAGKGARYTKGGGPFRLVYRETCEGRAEASRRETAIKLLARANKLRVMRNRQG